MDLDPARGHEQAGRHPALIFSVMELSLSETLEALQRLGIAGNTGADDTLASWLSIRSIPPTPKPK